MLGSGEIADRLQGFAAGIEVSRSACKLSSSSQQVTISGRCRALSQPFHVADWIAMFTTTVFAVFLVVLLIVRIALYALCLRLGLRWAKVADVPLRRAFVASAVIVVLGIVLDGLFSFLSPTAAAQAMLWSFVGLAVTIFASCWIISRFFAISALRSLQAWLPTLLSSAVMLLVALFVIRPYVFEGFVSPTNAMAPSLLGNHWQSTCPDCGQPSYCSPVDGFFSSQELPRMICENFHVHQLSDVDRTTFPGDQFLVAKFVAPQRWDIVVFRYPENPSTLYVMRLVGLPGETIQIEDGAVWANGVRLEVPESLEGIEYLSKLPGWPETLWGSPERPAELQDDEYFVLGDFSANAADSRSWHHGAPGHNAFAVPRSYIRGVVSHIFLPLERIRIVR